MSDSIQQFIRLSLKARKTVSGYDAVRAAVSDNMVYLMLLAEDASKRTKDQFLNLASLNQIPVAIYGTKVLLGEVLKKPPRSVVAITDLNFARGMLRALERGEGHIMIGSKSRR